MSKSLTYINGITATAEDLIPLAFAGYAHFTAMQVRDFRIRGLDLHLKRLRDASDELFGYHLPDQHINRYIRTAITNATKPDISLACYLFSYSGEFTPAPANEEIAVLIKTTDAVTISPQPRAFDLISHERHLFHLKHVGEIAKTYFLRQAQSSGFDDAAFLDSAGRISEATIWNLAFWDGQSVIWPKANYLAGITMQILSRQLMAMGVPQRTQEIYATNLHNLTAVAMNSQTPALPLSRLGNQQLHHDPQFQRILTTAYAQEPRIEP